MLQGKMQAMPAFSFNINDMTVNIFNIPTAGEGHPKHVHNYDHVTAVHSGKILVTTEKHGSFELTKDSPPVLFPKDEWHELEALEDGTSFTNYFGLNANNQTNLSE
tara:strand:- start:1803 stop:2120 length:318 start_codon:yes stop_codon:yes gene_type:complete